MEREEDGTGGVEGAGGTRRKKQSLLKKCLSCKCGSLLILFSRRGEAISVGSSFESTCRLPRKPYLTNWEK